MLSVIMLHTCYGGNRLDMMFYISSAIGVPLFFTVSGYLLLQRKTATWKYSFRKIGNIIKYIILSILVYKLVFYGAYILKSIIVGTQRTLSEILMEAIQSTGYDLLFCMVQRGDFFIYWFFGALIILYLLYPLIHMLCQNRMAYLMVLTGLCIVEIAIMFANLHNEFEHSIPGALRQWNWLFYFMLGGAFHMINTERIQTRWIVFVGALIFTYMACSRYGILKVPDCAIWYFSPSVMMVVSGIFLLCNRINISSNVFVANSVVALSALFLPVYSYHCYVMSFVCGFIPARIIRFAVVAILSIILGKILTSIPYLKNIYKI